MSLDFDPGTGVSSPACTLDEFERLSGAERDEVFMDTERQIRRLQAVQALRLHRVSRSGSHFDDGHRTATFWHRRVTNGSPSTSRHTMLVADMLSALPVVATAALAGDLGADQLRLLAHLYDNPRARDQLGGHWERELVDHARRFSFHDFDTICRRWEANADPDGARQRHEIARTNRSAQRSVVGEGSQITITGDALSGEICWDVIQAHANAEYLTDVERRVARYGDDAANHPLARTHAQRLHDAFVAVCLTARDAAATKHSDDTIGADAHPTRTTDDGTTAEDSTSTDDGTTVDDGATGDAAKDHAAPADTEGSGIETPEATPGEVAGTGSRCCAAGMTDPLVVLHSTGEYAIAALLEYFGFDPTEYFAIAERLSPSRRMHFCHTGGGAPIDPRTLAVALLCGQVQRIVTDPTGHTINLGRKTRLFTGAARDAVLLNDDRCSNCGARHRGIQVDHLLGWEDLGFTDQDNAGPNCGWCNRAKHDLKIRVRRDQTGWHYHRRDGTEITPRWPPPGSDPPNAP